MDDSFSNHPRQPLPPDTILERLIEANIDQLAEGSASARDVLHLNPQLLNSCHYQSHHMAMVAVKDEEGMTSSGALATYGLSTASTHAIITSSSIQALSWQR
jgi:hypothetical protein